MTLWHGADEVELLWYGADEVDVAWYGADEVFPPGTAPPPPSGDVVLRLPVSASIVQDLTIRGQRSRFSVTRGREGNSDYLYLNLAAYPQDHRPARQPTEQDALNLLRSLGRCTVVVAGTTVINGVWGGHSAGELRVTWRAALNSLPDTGGEIVITSHAPDSTTNSLDLNARRINAVAAGQFDGEINWQPTAKGTTYYIRACFTHGNGHQLRFSSLAEAQAFKAANLLVNTGIPGQQPYRSSQMDVIDSIRAAQYRAFPGRYVGGTSYTVTISE